MLQSTATDATPSLGPTKPPRLRVGVVALGGLGGSSRVACQLALGLRDRGHHAVLLSSARAWWCGSSSPAVPTVGLPVPHAPRASHRSWVGPLATSLLDAVIEHDLHVLSVHYGVGLAAAAIEARRQLAARGRRLRVCVTLHGTDVTRFGAHADQGAELLDVLRQCDEVTAVSGWLADRAQRVVGLSRRPVVIANGVDTELFRPRPRQPGPHRPVLCHASNFRAVKRPLDAIAVLERLRERGLDAELWMVGDGPLREDARDRARPLGDAVRFLPPTSPRTLARLLSSIDLSLVTSASESFGLFALESMASGVPVLGTRCGGLEEVFEADRTGELGRMLLAPVGDVDQLAARADAVLRDPSRLVELRRRALTVGRTAFPREAQLGAYTEVLSRLGPEAA